MTKNILYILLAAIVYLLGSRAYFYNQSQKLFASSGAFTNDYSVGKENDPLVTYLVLGDSTAVGTGAASVDQSYPYLVAAGLAEPGYKVHVINHAKSGARLHDLITNQLPFIDSVNPTLVTISIGANDATHFTSHAEYQQDLRTLRDVISKHPSTQFVVANAPDMGKTIAIPQPLRALIGYLAKQENDLLLQEIPDLHLADIYGQAKLTHLNEYASDRFHPSALGYQSWASVFLAAINKKP